MTTRGATGLGERARQGPAAARSDSLQLVLALNHQAAACSAAGSAMGRTSHRRHGSNRLLGTSHTHPRCGVQKLIGARRCGTDGSFRDPRGVRKRERESERAGQSPQPLLDDATRSRFSPAPTLDTVPDAPDDRTVTPGSQLALLEEPRARKCSSGAVRPWFAAPEVPHGHDSPGRGPQPPSRASRRARNAGGHRRLGPSSTPGGHGRPLGPPPFRSPATSSPMPSRARARATCPPSTRSASWPRR